MESPNFGSQGTGGGAQAPTSTTRVVAPAQKQVINDTTTNLRATVSPVTRDQHTISNANIIAQKANISDSIGGIFDIAENYLKQKKATAQESSLNQFMDKQLSVATALEQGKIRSSAAARTQMRVNLRAFVEANPSLRAEAISLQSDLLGLGGGAKIVSEGDLAEQRRVARESDLVSRGLVSADADANEMAQADSADRMAQAAAQKHKARIDEIDERLKLNTLANSDRSRLENERQDATREFVQVGLTSEYGAVKTQYNQIISSGASDAEKLAQVDDFWANFLAESGAILSGLPQDERQVYMKPFEMQREIAKQRITGELSDAEAKRRQDRVLQTHKSIALQDPVIAKAVAMSSLMSGDVMMNEIMSSSSGVAGALSKFFASTSSTADEEDIPPFSPFTLSKQNGEAVKKGLNILTDGVLNGTEAQKEEAKGRFESFLRAVEEGEGYIKTDPKRGRAIAEFMATTDFLKIRNAHPEIFEQAGGAVEIMQRHYADEVWGMVQNEFVGKKINVYPIEANRGGFSSMGGSYQGGETQAREVDAVDFISSETIDTGVRFTTDSKNPDVKTQTDYLNRELAPVINRHVKAFAHLDGRTDYGKYWEEIRDDLFDPNEGVQGGQGEDSLAGGDSGDDLKIEDFLTKGIEAVDPLPDEQVNDLSGTYSGPGFTGTPQIKVEGMIIHHTGGREPNPDHLVRVLKENTASVQFFIDRDAKVHQLMPDNHKAWHASKNNNSGYDNNNTVGVEIAAREDSDVTDAQVEAAKALIRRMSTKHGFDPSSKVFGHGEVATHKRPTEGGRVLSSMRGE